MINPRVHYLITAILFQQYLPFHYQFTKLARDLQVPGGKQASPTGPPHAGSGDQGDDDDEYAGGLL